MEKRSSLTASITATVVSLFLVQAVLFTAISLSYRIAIRNFISFYPVVTLFHGLILFLLLLLHEYFYLLPSGEKLQRVNFTNILTLFRVSSLPTICYLLIARGGRKIYPVLIPFICIVFLTDLFDGMLSRKLGQITQIGKFIDSASDYTVLIGISILFFHLTMLPLWLFALIMFRFLLQAGWIVIVFMTKKTLKHKTTIFGKIAVFATMALYAFEICKYLKIPYIGNGTVVSVLEYIAAGLIFISIFDKLIVMKSQRTT